MKNKDVRKISTLGSRATSLVSVCLVLIMAGLGALVGIAGVRIQQQVRGNMGFVVVMERDCPQGTVDTMKKRLHGDKAIERYAYTSPEAILSEEAANLGSDILAMLEANPYSAEFEVRVRPAYSGADSIAALVDRYREGFGVADVVCDNEVLEGLDNTLRRVTLAMCVLAAVLLIISLGLINNAVSLSIYGRRFIIHTMKLVGATPGFIRRPFVLAAARGGLLAGSIAGGLILAGRYYAPQTDSAVAELLPWPTVAAVAAAMVVVGGILCAATAYFAAGRYLRASYDEMFMK